MSLQGRTVQFTNVKVMNNGIQYFIRTIRISFKHIAVCNTLVADSFSFFINTKNPSGI